MHINVVHDFRLLFRLELGSRNSNCLRVTVADANADALDASLAGSLSRSTVQLYGQY